MATTFDGPSLTITLNAGGSVHEVDTLDDLYSEWKRWLKTSQAQYEPAFRVVGGDPLTPGIDAGSYFFLRNDLGWRIKPAEEDATIYLTGNLTPEDSSLPILLPTDGDFSVLVAGLQPITQSVEKILTQAQSAEYRGIIAIDTVNGVSGTAYPVGLANHPVNNTADALVLAGILNIYDFTLKGTITLTGSSISYSIQGLDPASLCVINLNGQSVNSSRFINVRLAGSGSGITQCEGCEFDGVSGITGILVGCVVLNSFTIAAGDTKMLNCWGGVAGSGKGTINLNGQNAQVSAEFVGDMEFTNVSHASAELSAFVEGRVVFPASCTAGIIVLGGEGSLIDNSAGSTMDIEGLHEANDSRLARKRLMNREYTNPSTNKLEQYNDADDAIENEAPIFEDNGVTPWDGTGPIRRRDKME